MLLVVFLHLLLADCFYTNQKRLLILLQYEWINDGMFLGKGEHRDTFYSTEEVAHLRGIPFLLLEQTVLYLLLNMTLIILLLFMQLMTEVNIQILCIFTVTLRVKQYTYGKLITM